MINNVELTSSARDLECLWHKNRIGIHKKSAGIVKMLEPSVSQGRFFKYWQGIVVIVMPLFQMPKELVQRHFCM